MRGLQGDDSTERPSVAQAEAQFCQVGSVFNVQLSHYVGPVMAYSTYAYEKKSSYVFVGFSLGNQFQDFFFS